MVGDSLPSACSAEDKERLAQSLTVLVNYAELFGFRPDSFDRQSTLTHWQLCSAGCGWIKFLKYKLAAFMSYHLDNPLPKKPFSGDDLPNQLAGGSLGRFIKLKFEDPEIAIQFCVGVLYLKKGMPRPTDLALEQAKMETKKVLTSVQQPHASPFSSTAVIAEEVRRTCVEIFTRRIRRKDLEKPYAPSVKANYVDSRSKFGTFGTLMDEHFLVDRVPPENVGWLYSTALELDDSVREDEMDTVHLKVSPLFRERVNQVYREVYQNVRVRAREEVANVKLVALPEALKVRTISKGPPLTYFSLKPVQKFLHRVLRNIRCFRLVGQTVTPEFLSEVFIGREGVFHSLDYSSATDLLDPFLSGVCVDGICDAVGMPDDLRQLFHKALTGHLIEDEPQVWGQLMGSIVSFIVLCVVNLSVIRHSFELTLNTRVSVVDIPAVINGDDGLVRAPPEFSHIWESVAAVAGLIPSVGKTYVDEEYLNINSTSFLFENETFRLIPYVNMGLVMGLGRSGGKQDVTNIAMEYTPYLTSIGARHHALLNLAPPGKVLAAHEQFLRQNAETLKLAKVPWYIPESLGGVGLKPIVLYNFGDGDVDNVTRRYARTSTGHVCGPSPADVRAAEVIVERRYASITPRRIPSQQPIRARSVWQSVVKLAWPRKRVVMSQEDETFMDLSTYYLTPSLVASGLDQETRVSMIRRNERAWTSLMAHMTDFPSERCGDLFLDFDSDRFHLKVES